MYRKKDKSKQSQIQMVSIEELVPQDHMLREIENAIDWSFIYDEVKGLYKEAEWGNPGIDPVVLFKIVFIQYLYGIRSMRQTIKEIEVNIAYRWFIGYDLTEPIPHFSTFGKNYKRRFEGTDIFERIFRHILEEAVRCGFVDASAIFIDGTHIRANANKKHGLRFTQLRGLAKVTMQVTLTFACMNLKKLARWKRKTFSSSSFFAAFWSLLLSFLNSLLSMRKIMQKNTHVSAFVDA